MEANRKEILILLGDLIEEMDFLNRLPDRKSLSKNKLKELTNKIGVKIITPSVISNIIGDLAFDEVLSKTKHDNPDTQGKKKFSELKGVSSQDVVNKTYELLLSLPQPYTFIFKLPKVSKPFPKVNFDYGVDMMVLDESTIKEYGEKSARESFVDLLSSVRSGRSNLSVGDPVLIIRGNGYVGKYGIIKVKIKEDPLFLFKFIMGIYDALDITHKKKDSSYLQPFSVYSYDIYDSKNKLIRTMSESTEDAQYVLNLEFDEEKFILSDMERLIKKKTTQFEYANSVISNLLKIIKPNGKPDKSVIKKQVMLKNAAYWFYEARKIDQEHVKAVYVTTAFDSLLNAKGKDDTKEYKSAMVANSIAKDALEGDGITQGICELYSLRNQIVHGEKKISSLEKYDDEIRDSSESIALMGLWYLSRYLSNRIHYINGGFSRFIRMIVSPALKSSVSNPKKTN